MKRDVYLPLQAGKSVLDRIGRQDNETKCIHEEFCSYFIVGLDETVLSDPFKINLSDHSKRPFVAFFFFLWL